MYKAFKIKYLDIGLTVTISVRAQKMHIESSDF